MEKREQRSLNIIPVLKKLAKIFEENYIEYCIVGSTSLFLEGVPVVPSDIDVLTTKDSAFKIDELLSPYRLVECKLRESEVFRSYFGRYKIDGIDVEVMGEFQYRKDDKWSVSFTPSTIKTKYVSLNDEKIRIAELEETYKFCKEIGREKTCKIIEEYLRELGRKIKL